MGCKGSCNVSEIVTQKESASFKLLSLGYLSFVKCLHSWKVSHRVKLKASTTRLGVPAYKINAGLTALC